ncbi:MAG: hypothetical protein B5766_05380 [Candidatus Lumbricidophila eiseniae]|uniref:Uncharacterized protein n=1 Tax=Candidatus Lumbricidiphila eiseniae TaxID=1969409 RepID=A0A2A6FS48_9MICO|nr:MAG: hypothetical protein B5766_05380 [Candidatus Lumbricidophila eiseniae]
MTKKRAIRERITPKPARGPYTLRKQTPVEIADAVVFECGTGGGSASEYKNIREAAERGFNAGKAAASNNTSTTATVESNSKLYIAFTDYGDDTMSVAAYVSQEARHEALHQRVADFYEDIDGNPLPEGTSDEDLMKIMDALFLLPTHGHLRLFEMERTAPEEADDTGQLYNFEMC